MGGSGSKDISKITSQSELSKEYFDSLTNNGTLNSGGRSGGNLPTQSAPNSYYTTPDGHVIIYGDDGYRLMDISKDRIKIEIFNRNPNNPNLGRWSSRKLKDSAGAIEKTLQWILDYFGI